MKYWIDGCFDFFHHGHANVLLQSKTIPISPSSSPSSSSSTKVFLEIGIHSDEEITLNKGPPVMNLKERIFTTKANKWCDSVFPDAPYVTSLELIKSEHCDYVIHGDDITTDKDGNDCYQEIKDAGMMKLVKRTGGVSTTELIGRLLNNQFYGENGIHDVVNDELVKRFGTASDGITPWNNIWYVSSTESGSEDGGKLQELQIVDGSIDVDNALYIVGSFDLFNPYHITVLEQYKDKNIIIGIIKDGDFIMSLLQRTLCVLQCKYVKNVIIGVDETFNIGKQTIGVDSFHNEFSYLKNNGIRKRIEDDIEKYHDRQKKKNVKAELEVQMAA